MHAQSSLFRSLCSLELEHLDDLGKGVGGGHLQSVASCDLVARQVVPMEPLAARYWQQTYRCICIGVVSSVDLWQAVFDTCTASCSSLLRQNHQPAVAMHVAVAASKRALFRLNCAGLNDALDAYIGSPERRATSEQQGE